MAGKVYLLIDGLRDERCVRAAFSTRAAARAALRFGDEDAAVEGVPLDPPLPPAPEGHSLWYVLEEEGNFTGLRIDAFSGYDIGRVTLDAELHTVEVWAVDEDHAIELGADLISRYKAGMPA